MSAMGLCFRFGLRAGGLGCRLGLLRGLLHLLAERLAPGFPFAGIFGGECFKLWFDIFFKGFGPCLDVLGLRLDLGFHQLRLHFEFALGRREFCLCMGKLLFELRRNFGLQFSSQSM